MTRGDLTDAQWASLQPLLPPQKPRISRPNHDHRPILNGILWILRTGAPWRDLPERYGKPSTVSTRFYRWRRAGIWDRIFAAVQRQADTTGALDWAVHYVDATVVRAHQHAAGAKGSDAAAEGLGRSRGGFSTKAHLRADGGGKPLTLVVTPGQTHESGVFAPLLERGGVARPGRGRPKQRPRRVVADKGYSGRAIRAYLRRRGIRMTIPRKRNERRRGPFDRAAYRAQPGRAAHQPLQAVPPPGDALREARRELPGDVGHRGPPPLALARYERRRRSGREGDDADPDPPHPSGSGAGPQSPQGSAGRQRRQ